MGILRLLLATLVLASHVGYSLFGLNPGVIAVVAFYLLAGYVVAGLWEKWASCHNAVRLFYQDRLWRILPQYYAALVASALLVWLTQPSSPFLSAQPGGAEYAAHALVIPLAYYMFTGWEHYTLIPPAWSLGVELQFYLLAPWLLRLKRGALAAVVIASLLIFSAAQLQWLDTDHFGYRLLPGVLFLFLAGVALRRPKLHLILLVLWLVMVSYGSILFISGHYQPYNKEVVVGFCLGLPLIAWLQHCPLRDGWLGVLNKKCAELSYGLFLWHFPVIWLLELQPPAQGASTLALVISLSGLLAWVGHHFIEYPLWCKYRINAP